MTDIKNSKAICGSCGKTIELKWDIVDIHIYDGRQMGEEAEYNCEGFGSCNNCGKNARIEMVFWEYPVGCIEGKPEMATVNDEEPITREIDVPDIQFFDL